MSRSTLYAAGPDGDMEPVQDYRNAWLFAVVIWRWMIDNYLRKELPEGSASGRWLGNKPVMEKLWQLAYEPSVPWIESVCLAATFDRALVRGSERVAIVNAFRSFMTLVESECHLGAMAADIEVLPENTRAIGWYPTSVAENLWFVTDDEADEEGRAYNIDRDTGHFWIFEEIR